MKSIMLVLAVIALFAGCAMTPIPAEQRQVVKIYEVELSKDEIFSKANEWIARAFVDHDAVVEYSDKATGKIYGNGSVIIYEDLGMPIERPCKFQFIIEVKEGKIRATADRFEIKFPDMEYVPIPEYYAHINDELKTMILASFEDMHLSMTEKEDDW